MRPIFSIITPAYNCESTIGDCLRSIYAQDMPPDSIEHLVIDGLSQDNTVAEVERLADSRTKITSEADNGMYDAANKGIRQARGEYIGMLNADDSYTHSRVLASIYERFQKSQAKTAYGDLEYVAQHDTRRVVRYWRSGEYRRSRFRWGWMPPHPTFFVHRSIYEEFGLFREDLKIAADYEIMLRFLFRNRVSSTYLPDCIVRMRLGGLSNTPANLWRKSSEDAFGCSTNGLRPATFTVGCKIIRKVPQFVFRASGNSKERK